MRKVVDLNKARAASNRAVAGKDRAGRLRPKDRPSVKKSSSVIARIDYDDETGELDITFTTQKKYRYFDVPSEVYYGFLDAPSKGEFFNAQIRDRYAFSEVFPRR